jgi:hypothetical protein
VGAVNASRVEVPDELSAIVPLLVMVESLASVRILPSEEGASAGVVVTECCAASAAQHAAPRQRVVPPLMLTQPLATMPVPLSCRDAQRTQRETPLRVNVPPEIAVLLSFE